jgi:hypothetical protein
MLGGALRPCFEVHDFVQFYDCTPLMKPSRHPHSAKESNSSTKPEKALQEDGAHFFTRTGWPDRFFFPFWAKSAIPLTLSLTFDRKTE